MCIAACGGGTTLPTVDASGSVATAAAPLGPRIAFYVCAAIVLGGALVTITRRNAVTAVMSLVATFFGLAAVYTLLSAHFLAAIQVLVYAGAIMTLFVFVVMLLNREEVQRLAHRGVLGRAIGLGLVIALLVFVGLLARREGTAHLAYPMSQPVETATGRTEVVAGTEVYADPSAVSRVVGRLTPSPVPLAVTGRTPEYYRIEYAPGQSGFVNKAAVRPIEGFGGVASVGNVLFDDYLFPFEAISLLLLIAVIGAVVVARIPRRRNEEAGAIEKELGATTPLAPLPHTERGH